MQSMSFSEICTPAIYTPASLPEYLGNPLYEALPTFRGASEVMESFGLYPAWSAAERTLSKADRTLCVCRLDSYLEPLTDHFDLVEHLCLLIRSGYRHRNPRSPDYYKSLNDAYRQSKSGIVGPIQPFVPTIAPTLSLIGISGSGKSTAIERCLSFFPRFILHPSHLFHTTYVPIQVVWIKVDFPFDGGLKQMLLTIWETLKNELGLKDLDFLGPRDTTDQWINAVSRLLAKLHLGVLVIDEVHNLLNSRGYGREELLGFFVNFTNLTKIPLVVVGPPSARTLFIELASARRLSGRGTIAWDRMLPGPEWDFFLAELWKYQWIAKPCDLSTDLRRIFYFHTQGIRALAVRLYQLSQLHAIRSGSEKITPALVKKIAQEKFLLIEPALAALRSGNRVLIEEHDKLLTEGVLSGSPAQLMEETPKARLEQIQSTKRRIRFVSTMIHLGHDSETVQRLAECLQCCKLSDDDRNLMFHRLQTDQKIAVPLIKSLPKDGPDKVVLEMLQKVGLLKSGE